MWWLPRSKFDAWPAGAAVVAAGIDKAGKITWRYQGQVYSIGIGRTHTETRIIVLSQDLDIRIIDAAAGELLRELVLDTSKRYQGTGRPPGPIR